MKIRHVFCTVVITVINLEAVTMHHNKNTQEKIVLMEAAVWAFWILFFCISYMFANVML